MKVPKKANGYCSKLMYKYPKQLENLPKCLPLQLTPNYSSKQIYNSDPKTRNKN